MLLLLWAKQFALSIKALHSELLTELSSQFSSRNEFFTISEVQVLRHFFLIFGNFGIEQFPKIAKTKSSEKFRLTQGLTVDVM